MPSLTDALSPWNQEASASVDIHAIHKHICSESLAQLYAKKGMLGQAKEIYQRLMVRYPEKKSYFEQKIQALKNT